MGIIQFDLFNFKDSVHGVFQWFTILRIRQFDQEFRNTDYIEDEKFNYFIVENFDYSKFINETKQLFSFRVQINIL